MSQLTIPSPPDLSVLKARVCGVRVDGQWRADLKVSDLQRLAGPQFGRATLTVHEPTAQAVATPSVAALPPIGARVDITPGHAALPVLLAGVVVAHQVRLDQAGQVLLAQVAHRLGIDLQETISRRYCLGDGVGTIEADDVPVRFGRLAGALASQDAVNLRGRLCRVFDASLSARPWTVADALAYLLAAHAPADVEAPTLQQLCALTGELEIDELDLTGQGVYQALSSVAGLAGVQIRAGGDGRTLVFFRPGLDGVARRVALQAPGQSLRLDRTNLHRAAIDIRRRPDRPTLLLLGQPKRYEATFLLQPGWDPAHATTRWRDTARSLSADWSAYGDVYRRWVLNEHGWLGGLPWELPLADLSSISGDFTLHVPRPLGPCLSTSTSGRSLGVVVEVRMDDQAPWRRWRGPLWISQTQAAVYLGGDGLPGDFFEAAVAGDASVRVTATVASDARLALRVGGDPSLAPVVIQLPQARWAAVSQQSIFYQQAGLGPPAVCDDAAVLEAWASAPPAKLVRAAAAQLTLGWIDTAFEVGDLVERVEGRPLDLRGNPDTTPWVQAVRHDFANQTTELTLRG
jgi:hypothetical protein